MKRIVVCADGTWNRPEKNLKKDFPTNVLKLARGIKPIGDDGISQQVFYDWGIGSYHDNFSAGITGKDLHKNVMDCYRYIVQNYEDGDMIYLFGFSRGAYTIRSLCGLINNCGILKRENANLIEKAFNHYKKRGGKYSVHGNESIKFRKDYSCALKNISFVGVWDTVGAMGIPISFLGFFEDKDNFYDNKIGSNVKVARHALSIDEKRADFEPTIWDKKENVDIKQVWFCGVHSNIGGSYKPDKDGTSLSDITLSWMIKEAQVFDLYIEKHLINSLKPNALAKLHNSKRHFFRLKRDFLRQINPNKMEVLIHSSVKKRWEENSSYRPKNLKKYLDEFGYFPSLEE